MAALTTNDGFMFVCNYKSYIDCARYGVFGLPARMIPFVELISPGVKLFLFDNNRRCLYGVYTAVSFGRMNWVPEAFGGRYPAQVRFKLYTHCPPLPEFQLSGALNTNQYISDLNFNPLLTPQQVAQLMGMFSGVVQDRQPAQLPFAQSTPHRQYSHPFEGSQAPPALGQRFAQPTGASAHATAGFWHPNPHHYPQAATQAYNFQNPALQFYEGSSSSAQYQQAVQHAAQPNHQALGAAVYPDVHYYRWLLSLAEPNSPTNSEKIRNLPDEPFY